MIFNLTIPLEILLSLFMKSYIVIDFFFFINQRRENSFSGQYLFFQKVGPLFPKRYSRVQVYIKQIIILLQWRKYCKTLLKCEIFSFSGERRLTMQNQLLADVLQSWCFHKFCIIHRKTYVLEFPFKDFNTSVIL